MLSARTTQSSSNRAEVGYELAVLIVTFAIGGGAENRGGMNGCSSAFGEFMREEFPARFSHAEGASKDGLGGSGAEADDDLGTNQLELGFEPRGASLHFRCARFLVKAAFAAFFEFEVLHRVGEVDIGSRDAGVLKRAIEELARGADEGTALTIFLVSGLFSNEYDWRVMRSFAQHGLRSMAVQIAAAAALDLHTKFRQGGMNGNEILRAGKCTTSHRTISGEQFSGTAPNLTNRSRADLIQNG